MRQHITNAKFPFAPSVRYGMFAFGGNHEVFHFNAKGAKGFTPLRALNEVSDQCLFVLLLVGHSCLTCQSSTLRRLLRILLEVEHRRREITLTRIGEDSDDDLASVFGALSELSSSSNSSA